MVSLIQKAKDWWNGSEPGTASTDTETVQVSAMAGYNSYQYNGDKFEGGYGYDNFVKTLDYWTLRQRSSELFQENLYARGVIKRLITNEINTGLTLEAVPEEEILGVPLDSLNDWSENVENRFNLYSENKDLSSFKGDKVFAKVQFAARMEALISGDVLVVLRTDQRTGLPAVELVRGDRVQTPVLTESRPRNNNRVIHGVELDSRDRHVAYWIRQDEGESKRIPARGTRGRRTAWLLYGTENRLNDLRGEPLLSVILQSLKEVDRYRDSAQRKAVINSMLAMFIRKTEDKMGTLPMQGAAVRKDSVTVTDNDGGKRSFDIASQMPGIVMQELQHGEEPVGFQQHTDVDFGKFESTIIQAVAWSLEIPPEILTLSFNSNYSASQAALNEFKIYLNRVRGDFATDFCKPVYADWLLAEVLNGDILAPRLVEAWRDPQLHDIFGAWIASDWSGAIKPSTDIKKQAQGYEIQVKNGWVTNRRAAREQTGTKFSKNVQIIKKENELMAEAMRPLLELKAEFGEKETDEAIADTVAQAVADNTEEI